MNKVSDIAVFGIFDPNTNDEMTKFQLRINVSCNEAISRLFSFPIYKRHLTIVHLAVHLENRCLLYGRKSCANSRTTTSDNIDNFFLYAKAIRSQGHNCILKCHTIIHGTLHRRIFNAGRTVILLLTTLIFTRLMLFEEYTQFVHTKTNSYIFAYFW